MSTSLTLFNWFRQFSIYKSAFISKINYYNATTTTRLGSTIPSYNKIIGWIGLFLILIIILGPIVLFSGLNPATQQNLVISGSLEVALTVKDGNAFTLYSSSHFATPPTTYTPD